MSRPSIAVVGGGVIGLSTALALADRGVCVTVFEPGDAGAQSSWAGAGILFPLLPWDWPALLRTRPGCSACNATVASIPNIARPGCGLSAGPRAVLWSGSPTGGSPTSHWPTAICCCPR
ncbi:MAG: FAD-binding oxidoreductase [Betaproteobacteria bacterium]|nr:FAD-binding oxidoreductase [Betaproteobacteria bacterium]